MTRPSSRATAVSLTLACALLISACDQKTESAAGQEQPAPKVGIVTLSSESFTLTSELPGRTAAYRIAEVRPQVTGGEIGRASCRERV